MAITISNAYIETFENNVRHLAQQSDTRLRRFVTEVNRQSEKHNWDRLAQSAYRAKTAARMVSPAGGSGSGAVDATDGLAWTRRQTIAATYDAGEVIEMEDPIQMLIDPTSASTQNLAMSMRRAYDDVIIDAATGVSKDGDGGDVAWDTGQTVGDGSAAITLADIITVQQKFNEADVDVDERKCLVVGPVQWAQLLQVTEVVSTDFQRSQALATGMLPNVMGFDIVLSNRLNFQPDGAGTSATMCCLAFTKKGIGLHVARDITARVGERTDMSFAWQLYCQSTFDAKRIEDEHVVALHVLNS